MPKEPALDTDYLSLKSASHPAISTAEAAFGRFLSVLTVRFWPIYLS